MTYAFNTEGQGGDDDAEREIARLRAEVRQLRVRDRSRPLIAQAQGILRERYGLPDAETAFALMQQASQRFNVKLRTLADAISRLPRPARGAPLWFPKRARLAPPPLDSLDLNGAARTERSTVLSTVLTRTMTVAGTDMGNVQLLDPVARGLRIEKHTGLSSDFVSFFDFVGETGTSCAQAAKELAQVTVRDVATDPVFDEDARLAILTAGSRGVHSVPLTTERGDCIGMVSAHHARPLRELSAAQLAALERVGRQAGQWLNWYDRTVVLDALESLHSSARERMGTSIRRR